MPDCKGRFSKIDAQPCDTRRMVCACVQKQWNALCQTNGEYDEKKTNKQTNEECNGEQC